MDFQQIALTGTFNEQVAAAKSRRCPPDVLRDLANVARDYSVRRTALKNPTIPSDVLETVLAESIDPWQAERNLITIDRVAALQNPGISPELLAVEAARHDDRWACPNQRLTAVLRHPRCPVSLLTRFAGRNEDFRVEVAHNPALPADLLLSLLHDSSALVQRVAARNKACTIEQLLTLTDVTDSRLLGTLARRLPPGAARQARVDQLAERPGALARKVVAQTSTNESQLAGLAWDPHPEVRALVGANSAATEEARVAVSLQRP